MKNTGKILSVLLALSLCVSLCFALTSCKKKYKGEKIVPEERTEEIDGSDSEYSKLY